jgi:hypothetical protein
MGTWDIDWAVSLPLILLIVVIHVLGLGTINGRIAARAGTGVYRPQLTVSFVVVLAAATLMVTPLLALEGGIWAAAYRVVGALPDDRSAMLYSLGAITGYGHAAIFLDPHWQMMGALEAVNGVILFGLTTAFLLTMIQQIWPLGSRLHGRRD